MEWILRSRRNDPGENYDRRGEGITIGGRGEHSMLDWVEGTHLPYYTVTDRPLKKNRTLNISEVWGDD